MGKGQPGMIVDKTAVWLNHALLALVAAGVIWLLGKIIDKGGQGWDAAAFLLVLQSVLSVIRGGQAQISIDRATEKLGESEPRKQLPKPEDFPPERQLHEPHTDREPVPEDGRVSPDTTEAADAMLEAASEKHDELVGKD